jgi:predicted methyltransferase
VTDERADAIVREVAVAVRLAEGEAGVRSVIWAVRRLEPVATRALSRATSLPVPIVAAVAGELRKRDILARERPTRLTPRGRLLFGGQDAARTLDCTCTACNGLGHRIAEELQPLVAALERISAGAPPARTELDQSHCTAETKLRRALALHEADALDGRRVLLLGDDDLVALAIHLLSEYGDFAGSIRELAVIDTDPHVLAYIGRGLGDARFPVRLVEHDLRRPLPPVLAGRFDAVVTDPPYTAAGAELFLSRAASALRSAPGGQVFLAYGPKPPAESLRLQRAILRMGFVVRVIVPNFNEYLHASILGGASHLYHLVSTEETRPLVTGDFADVLYTGELRSPRPYRCASCSTIQRVGRGAAFPSVDVLRHSGCPECGATKFRPLPRGTGRASSAATRETASSGPRR